MFDFEGVVVDRSAEALALGPVASGFRRKKTALLIFRLKAEATGAGDSEGELYSELFSMPFVLGLVATHRRMFDFDGVVVDRSAGALALAP
jgi:hypothetical protein